jgi:glycerophosphoryl diester phosphodiesterase
MRNFKVVDWCCRSKTGDPVRCEDVVVDGSDFAVLCDGATDKSGWRHDGRTGGRLAAELVARTVAQAPGDCSAIDLVDRINVAYSRELVPLFDGVEPRVRPMASFCALQKRTGRVIRVGDVTWRSAIRVQAPEKVVDQRLAAARAVLLRCLLLNGADPVELSRTDPGRQMILPALVEQSAACNRPESGDLAYGAIDGRPVPEPFVEEWVVGDDETAVVLASDGYPRLFMSVQESERYLAEDLARDPLRIGDHPATKCAGPDMDSFDDRSLLLLVVQA